MTRLPAFLPRLPMLAACLLLAATGAHASELTDAYRTFREHFDAGRFEDALPPAQKVVELSEKQYGADQMELVIPLTNLGAVQLRMATYFDAEETFRRALEIVEARQGGFSLDIIRPLLGLGATYLAAGQYADAADQLRRALDVSRKIDGLFNPGQIEILDPLIRTYAAMEQEQEAERERDYAIRIAETAYGKDDARMLPALMRGARWYEDVERYASARRLYARALDIVAKAHGEKKKPKDVNDIRMVEPLRGMARAYRMEYLYGGKVWTEAEGAQSPVVAQGPSTGTSPLNEEGRKSLDRALEILKGAAESTPVQRGTVLLELGDYYWTSGTEKKAFESYKEAWHELSTADGAATLPMQSPAQVFYDAPAGTRHKPPSQPLNFDKTYVEFEFTVTPAGKVTNITTVTADATEKKQKEIREALQNARYRPKFVDGNPVEATGVRFRQDIWTEKKEAKK